MLARLTFLLLLPLFAACGQKGPLYLPPEPEPETTQAQATSDAES